MVELERWIERYRRNGPDVGVAEVQELEELVEAVSAAGLEGGRPGGGRPGGDQDGERALLDLAGVRTTEEERALRRSEELAEQVGRRTERVRVLGREALEMQLARDPKLGAWLASDVLALRSQPLRRRVAAARLLEGRYLPATQLALFGCALEEEPELRGAAMRALAGWPAEAVHRFMLDQLERLDEQPGWVERSTLLAHFEAVRIPEQSPLAAPLIARIRRGTLGTDWREAFRSIRILRALPDDPAVPALIAALSTWTDRRAEGAGSLRIEYELLRELRARSGRDLGAHPERWMTWWKVRSTAGDDPGRAERLSRAEFFGLRPATDRVVFVIDRSGSMKSDFSTTRSRYGEACAQMLAFLRTLGPRARFNVVLFSGEIDAWKPSLQPATEGNLGGVERWLRYQSPHGGTFLRPAIEHVLELDSRGRPDLARLEADSVVVLCDGATSEGPVWIARLLERVNDDACLAFHGVRIGPRGDGALELLAELSGGEFVEVD